MPEPVDRSERTACARTDHPARARALQALVALGIGLVVFLGWSSAASAGGIGGAAGGIVTGVGGTAGGIVEPVVTALPPAPVTPPSLPPAPAVPSLPTVPAPVAVPIPIPLPTPSVPSVPAVIEQVVQAPLPSPGAVAPPVVLPGGSVPQLPGQPTLPGAPDLPIDPPTTIDPVLPTPPDVPGLIPGDDLLPSIGDLARTATGPLAGPGSSKGNARPGHPDLAIAAGAPGDERIPAPIGTAATRTDPLSFSPAGNLGAPAATVAPVPEGGDVPSPSGNGPVPSSLPPCGAGASVDRAPQGTPSKTVLGHGAVRVRTGALGRLGHGASECSSVPLERPEVAPD